MMGPEEGQAMAVVSELAFDECLDRLRSGVVGRVAMSTPGGPHIIPLTYVVVGESVVVATSPYSVLGTYGRGATVAFEVDQLDEATRTGWSVVVRGRVEAVTDRDQVARLDREWRPQLWADGSRSLFLRILITEMTGRALGDTGVTPVGRALGDP
jgi:uncharacterized protein